MNRVAISTYGKNFRFRSPIKSYLARIEDLVNSYRKSKNKQPIESIFVDIEDNDYYDDENKDSVFSIYLDTPEGGRFLLAEMFLGISSISGIASAGSIKVEKSYRGMGIGTILNKMQIVLAADAGKPMISYEGRQKSPVISSILEKNGWKKIAEFDKQDMYITKTSKGKIPLGFDWEET